MRLSTRRQPLPHRPASRVEIVESVVSLAPRMGLVVDAETSVVGRSGHAWPVDAVLSRHDRKAGIQVLDETVPSFTERAIGWSADTGAPLVVVTSPMKADRLRTGELSTRNVLAISRETDHLAEQVVDSAVKLLQAA